MAKILLVRTKSEKYFHPYGAPPLGLMYLSAVLRQNSDHKVKIIDMRTDCLSARDVVDECNLFSPDVIGISSFTVELSMLHKVAQALKKIRPECPIIVGGPHANACAENVLSDKSMDYIVRGEGEFTFRELIEAISKGKTDVTNIKGVIFRNNNEIVETPQRDFIPDLDILPFPDWEAVDLKKYFKLPRFMQFTPPSARKPYMPIMTSRGCPFKCTYCHGILGKRFRARSAENVFSEIKTLHDSYGIDDFEIIDDCFNLDKNRVHKICDLIIDSDIKIKLSFPNGLRGDALDNDVLKKMKQAGTTVISLAPETGSVRLQKAIKKNMNLPKLQEMISCACKLGIHVHGFFMLGFPTETKEDLIETEKFIADTQLHTADFFIVNVFPNTEMYSEIKALGKEVPEEFNNIDYHDATFNVSEHTNEELLKYQRKLFLMFYLDFSRILRIFTSPVIKKKYLFYYFMIFMRRVVFRKRES